MNEKEVILHLAIKKGQKGAWVIYFTECGHTFDVYMGAKKRAQVLTDNLNARQEYWYATTCKYNPLACHNGTCFNKQQKEDI